MPRSVTGHYPAELRFAELTGDTRRKEMAVRQLNWATYMVDKDGKNKYFHDEVWLIDGYGDYIRHYLRAMAAAPELAPDNKDTLLRRSGLATLCSTARNGDAIGNQRHIYI